VKSRSQAGFQWYLMTFLLLTRFDVNIQKRLFDFISPYQILSAAKERSFDSMIIQYRDLLKVSIDVEND